MPMQIPDAPEVSCPWCGGAVALSRFRRLRRRGRDRRGRLPVMRAARAAAAAADALNDAAAAPILRAWHGGCPRRIWPLSCSAPRSCTSPATGQPDAMLDEEAVLAVLQEAGVSKDAAGQALSEWRRGSLEHGVGAPAPMPRSTDGPDRRRRPPLPIPSERVADVFDAALSRHLFMRGRRNGLGGEWLPRRGMLAELRRGLDFQRLAAAEGRRPHPRRRAARPDRTHSRVTLTRRHLAATAAGWSASWSACPWSPRSASASAGSPKSSLELGLDRHPAGRAGGRRRISGRGASAGAAAREDP